MHNLVLKEKKARIFVTKAILLLNTIICLAQPSKKFTMENLKSKSKAELIELALEILKEKQPSLLIGSDDFESSAWQTVRK